MATTQGHNPVTGTARGTAEAEAKAKAKADAAKARGEQVAAAKADRDVVSALRSVEKGVSGLAVKLAVAKAANVHRHTINPATGKPFASFAAYLSARSSEFPLMHKLLRKAIVAEMVAHGASIREMAAVTNASVGTVSNDAAEANGTREARPGGASNGSEDTDAAKATKAVKGLTRAIETAGNRLAGASDSELDALIKAGNQLVKVAKATKAARKATPRKAAPKGTSKATPADAAKAAPKAAPKAALAS